MIKGSFLLTNDKVMRRHLNLYSYIETLIDLSKGAIGTGFLTMPLVFYQSGWVVGIVATVLFAILNTYCIEMLFKVEYGICKHTKVPKMAYKEIVIETYKIGPTMFKNFSPYGGPMINIFICFYHLGCCCIYAIFIGLNVQQVVGYYHPGMELELYMTMCLPILILLNFIRDYKILAPFAMCGNVLTWSSFGLILYYIGKTGITLENRDLAGPFSNYPLFFGTIMFSLSCIAVAVQLENGMKTPRLMLGPYGVVKVSLTFTSTLYVILGLFGYLAYGEDIMESIPLNLTESEILAQVTKMMMVTAIFLSHPVQMAVPIKIICDSIGLEKIKYGLLYEYLIRISCVLATFGLAVLIPRLDLFIVLFGSMFISATQIMIPATLDMSFYWFKLKGPRHGWNITKNCIIIFIGLLGTLSGTYSSLSKIVESFM